MSAAEADDTLKHGEQARRVHVIDHELRFNPNRRKVRRLIEEGSSACRATCSSRP